jgi:hypothetical protein
MVGSQPCPNLAYYNMAKITAVKSFIVLAHGVILEVKAEYV